MGGPLLSRSAQRITQRCLPLTGGNWRTVQIGLADVNEDYLAPDHDDWKAGLGWGCHGDDRDDVNEEGDDTLRTQITDHPTSVVEAALMIRMSRLSRLRYKQT